MIDPKTLTEKDKGKLVRYTPRKGDPEPGILSSWNEENIFVRYNGSETGAATSPEQLEFVTEMRVMFTVTVKGQIRLQETVTFPMPLDDNENVMEKLVQQHMALIDPADPHQIEIVFLDEPDPNDKYFRFGTDPRGMFFPVGYRAV